ncbi:unnamed protein product [Ceutorhynchus assimilis]|uniref:Uncharacterized protein n=1 Tax=Ceutorhynchus assimilis TaxID=467358 RepID=A0A9N9QPR7_9CUCU|nr:unnamed protein product [Ceutorhynchus assimilis]
MVLFLTDLQLWLIVGTSTIIIFCLLAALFFCIRWLVAKKKNSRFYDVEDLPARKSSFLEIINSYRNYYRSYENTHNKLLNDAHQSSVDSDRNLMDSTDFSKGFTNCLLRINSTEDKCSRASTGSLRTYYSVNISRSNSKCSFVSCSEGSDIQDMV